MPDIGLDIRRVSASPNRSSARGYVTVRMTGMCINPQRASSTPFDASKTTKAAVDRGFGRDWKLGAGEGIRTLDPNLGKVVLYP